MHGPRAQELKAALQIVDNKDCQFLTYYGRLKRPCDELSNCKRVSGRCCQKRGCTRRMTKMQKYQQDEKLHQFILGLDDAILVW